MSPVCPLQDVPLYLRPPELPHPVLVPPHPLGAPPSPCLQGVPSWLPQRIQMFPICPPRDNPCPHPPRSPDIPSRTRLSPPGCRATLGPPPERVRQLCPLVFPSLRVLISLSPTSPCPQAPVCPSLLLPTPPCPQTLPEWPRSSPLSRRCCCPGRSAAAEVPEGRMAGRAGGVPNHPPQQAGGAELGRRGPKASVGHQGQE